LTLAEAPDVDASALERAESSHGSSVPYAGLACAAAGGALLLAAGTWYAKRRVRKA